MLPRFLLRRGAADAFRLRGADLGLERVRWEAFDFLRGAADALRLRLRFALSAARCRFDPKYLICFAVILPPAFLRRFPGFCTITSRVATAITHRPRAPSSAAGAV